MGLEKSVHVYGYNGDVDTGTEDISGANTAYTWAAAAVPLTIVSGSSDDDSADTGARTVRIYGLDTDYLEAEETVTLDGTTAAALAGLYVRLNDVRILTAGTGGTNAGALSISDTDSVVWATVPIGEGVRQSALYTIPKNYRYGMIPNWYAAKSLSSGTVIIRLQTRLPAGTAWVTLDKFTLSDAGLPAWYGEAKKPIRVEAGSDIRMTATSSADNAIVWGGFDVDLYDKRV